MAVRTYSQHQAAKPSGKTIKTIMGLLNAGDAAEAGERLEALIKRYPQDPQIIGLYARALQKQAHFAEAAALYQRARQAQPSNPEILINLAQCLSKQGDTAQALALLEQVLEKAPEHVEALAIKGDVYRDSQQLVAAVDCYHRARALDPKNWKLHVALAHLTTFVPDDAIFEVLPARLDADDLTPKERADLHFVLGKAYLDVADDEQAFAHFQQANRLMDETLPPIRAELERRLSFTRRYFGKALFDGLAPCSLQDRPQIIVAGLSRSGKSLVESLFRGVEGVTLAGEELVLGQYAEELLEPYERHLGEYLSQLTPERLRQDAEGYRQRLGVEDTVKITTVPGDLWFLGLIGLWMPNVPIIFCVRNLLDLGITGYFHQYLVPEGYRYTYDLHQMGRQIACSEKVMDHWTQVLPNPVYLVDYEALTRDPHTVMNNLLGDLGLRRSESYEELVAANADMLNDISPIVSLDAPMPVTDRFNGIGERFRDKIEPMIEGYKTIADAFPRLEHPAVFDQPLPEKLREEVQREDKPSESVSFDWQLPERVVAIDNGGQLLSAANVDALLELNAFEVIAFDPPSRLALSDEVKQNPHVQHFAHATLGDGQPATLHACLEPSFSASLPPLASSQLPEGQRQGASVLARLPLTTVALDAIEGLNTVDWLLLDDRHDGMAVLENGTRTLTNTLLLQVRVTFQPTHERQPNLAEVSHWAARHGFRFYRLLGFDYAQCMPPRAELPIQPEATELQRAHALFIPDHERLAALSDTQRLKLAFVLDTVYQIHDLSYDLLHAIGGGVGENYLKAKGFFDRDRFGLPANELFEFRKSLRGGDLDGLAGQLNDWAKRFPQSAQVRSLRGVMASLAGLDDMAVAHIDKAIELSPDDVTIRLDAIEVLLNAGLWWEAEQNVRRLEARCPKHEGVMRAVLQVMAASPLQSTPLLTDGLARCEELLQACSEPDTELLRVRASLLAGLGRVEESLEDIDRALTLSEEQAVFVRASLYLQQGIVRMEAGDSAGACESFWNASRLRPASRATQLASKRLDVELSHAAGALRKLGDLHQHVRELKREYKSSFKPSRFGLLSQGLESVWLPGQRQTEARLGAYRLERYLPESARALDISCGAGFLLIGMADKIGHGEGVGQNTFDIKVGEAVAEHLGIEHIKLSEMDFVDYHPAKPFDLVIASDVQPDLYVEKLQTLCAKSAIVLLESQPGRELVSIEGGFGETVALIENLGFSVLERGVLCDDGINQRLFSILGKS
ncbi:tetratricopeptide repeat protein [Halomonas sp. KM-1]|uniref:tetratricopeptide repeat protein n=1 Tax=Halomonas sp. KM-1 TaxID=590061 RepID=UPI0002898BE9|nr:tetratricopeptide repeat protein [Halomonas sp. KM-1]